MNKKLLYYISSGIGFFLIGLSFGNDNDATGTAMFIVGLLLISISWYLDR